MDCSPPGSPVHGDSPGKNTGMGCYALLQGIFPTQGSNPGLPHCRRILCQLSHQGSPREVKTNFNSRDSSSVCVRITTMGERSTRNIRGQVGIYSQGAESGLVDGKYYEETLRITVCSGYSVGAKLLQSCPILCDLIYCSPLCSSVLGIHSPGKNTGMGCSRPPPEDHPHPGEGTQVSSV